MVSHGGATVTTTGTAVPLSTTSVPCSFVTIYPKANADGSAANVGQVRIGGRPLPTDSGGIPAGKGIPLNPGDAGVVWPLAATNGFDLKDLYVDATNSGDSVQFAYGAP